MTSLWSLNLADVMYHVIVGTGKYIPFPIVGSLAPIHIIDQAIYFRLRSVLFGHQLASGHPVRWTSYLASRSCLVSRMSSDNASLWYLLLV